MVVFFHTAGTDYWDRVPLEVKGWHRSIKNSLPVVIVTDPACKNLYGKFNHSSLKGGDYRKIIRELKKKVASSKEEGTFSVFEATDDKAVKEVSKKSILRFEGMEYEEWTSIKGSTVSAMLVSASAFEATFKLKNGKTIKVTEKELQSESWGRVMKYREDER